MKKFITRTLYAVFLLLLVGVTALFFAPLLPIPNHIEVKIVKSGSMEPAIKTGGIVVIKPSATYHVGDVITFGEDSLTSFPITHRVVAVNQVQGKNLYQLKGDANEEPDLTLVKENEVIGKVIFTLPNVGYLLDFAKQPLGFILLIAFPATLIILTETIDIGKEIRNLIRRRKKTPMEKEVLKRIYVMNDDLRPVYLPNIKKKNEKTPFVVSVLVFLMAAGLIWVNPGSTVSYFNDTEISKSNLFNAGSLDFSIALDSDDSPNIKLTPEAPPVTIIPTVTGGVGNLLLASKVRFEQTGGNSSALCNAIDLTASAEPFNYSGKLTDFLYGTTTSLTPLTLDLSLSSGLGFTPTDTCLVDVVYSGWVDGKTEGIEYHDIERISLTISDPPEENISLSEFVVSDMADVVTESESESELKETPTTPEVVSESLPEIGPEMDQDQDQDTSEVEQGIDELQKPEEDNVILDVETDIEEPL